MFKIFVDCYVELWANKSVVVRSPGAAPNQYPPLATCHYVVRSANGVSLRAIVDELDLGPNDELKVGSFILKTLGERFMGESNVLLLLKNQLA